MVHTPKVALWQMWANWQPNILFDYEFSFQRWILMPGVSNWGCAWLQLSPIKSTFPYSSFYFPRPCLVLEKFGCVQTNGTFPNTVQERKRKSLLLYGKFCDILGFNTCSPSFFHLLIDYLVKTQFFSYILIVFLIRRKKLYKKTGLWDVIYWKLWVFITIGHLKHLSYVWFGKMK